MANREVLRELQARLAQRLQQARTEVRPQSWLAVEAAGLGWLMPLGTAGEIFAPVPLTVVPHTQPWFRGVANLRGGLHGVVDLAAFLGLRAVEPGAPLAEGSQFIALNARFGAQCALVVDRLQGLRSGGQLRPEPDDGEPRPAFAAARWRDGDGRVWQELDLAALARDEQFLAIALGAGDPVAA